MSEINPFVEVDYYQQAKDRVTYAFEDAYVFDKYINLLTQPQLDLQTVFKELLQQRSIDTAIGDQLDIIGRIVGQDRILIEADLAPYFGYIGAILPEGYGDLNDGSLGGFYWDLNNPLSGNITLNDEQYRLFIKAKILKNITSATPEDVIEFIQFVFEVEKVYISYDEGAHATILVSDDISLFERVLLTFFTEGKYRSYFVPKTLGVGYKFGSFDADNFFGFFGAPGAKGYGSLEYVTTQASQQSMIADYQFNTYKLFEFQGPNLVVRGFPSMQIVDSQTFDLNYASNTYSLWQDEWVVVGGGVYATLFN